MKGVTDLEAVIYTQEQLIEKCAEWQKVLRLQDWTVDLQLKRERDFTNKDCNAEIGLNEQKKIAFIKVIDPVDYQPGQIRFQDMEEDLVHELLHIHFWPLTRGEEGENLAEEQAINIIAKALIHISRRGGETKNEKSSNLR